LNLYSKEDLFCACSSVFSVAAYGEIQHKSAPALLTHKKYVKKRMFGHRSEQ